MNAFRLHISGRPADPAVKTSLWQTSNSFSVNDVLLVTLQGSALIAGKAEHQPLELQLLSHSREGLLAEASLTRTRA